MKKKINKIDKHLFNIISFLLLFSILVVYSIDHYSLKHPKYFFNTTLQHITYTIIGFFITIIVSKIHYKYMVALNIASIPIIILLLLITLIKGRTIHNINAARWLKIPIINISLQPSTLANLAITIYSAYYSAKKANKNMLKESFYYFFMPVLFTILLILPSNASSAIILLLSIFIILSISKYPSRPLLILYSIILGGFSIFIGCGVKYCHVFKLFNRILTWKKRIIDFYKNFFHRTINLDKKTQTDISLIAILFGRFFGQGPGKSQFKHILPQANSDFIYSIIIEEYGIVGGFILLSIYMFIMLRIIIIAHKTSSYFSSLLVLSLGIPIIIQAFIHIGVNIGLLPVTGQSLPFISTGGTSICINCLRLGIILNVSTHKQQNE